MPYVQDADFTAEMHKLILNQLTNIRDNVDSVLLNVYVYLSCSVYIVLSVIVEVYLAIMRVSEMMVVI